MKAYFDNLYEKINGGSERNSINDNTIESLNTSHCTNSFNQEEQSNDIFNIVDNSIPSESSISNCFIKSGSSKKSLVIIETINKFCLNNLRKYFDNKSILTIYLNELVTEILSDAYTKLSNEYKSDDEIKSIVCEQCTTVIDNKLNETGKVAILISYDLSSKLMHRYINNCKEFICKRFSNILKLYFINLSLNNMFTLLNKQQEQSFDIERIDNFLLNLKGCYTRTSSLNTNAISLSKSSLIDLIEHDYKKFFSSKDEVIRVVDNIFKYIVSISEDKTPINSNSEKIYLCFNLGVSNTYTYINIFDKNDISNLESIFTSNIDI